MVFNLFKKNSKTNKLNVSNNKICFKDLKNNLIEMSDADNYLVVSISNETAYLDTNQVKVLYEILNHYLNGEKIDTIANNIKE